MSDLTDFLLARIDEDEQEFHYWRPTARQHYDRLLDYCAAVRRIVEEYQGLRTLASHAAHGGDEESAATARAMYAGVERTLRALATVYLEHPDFLPEWRP